VVKTLFISPHPDDICYSAFAAAERSGRAGLLVTVFSRSFWNFRGLPEQSARLVTRLRVAEERGFAASLGLTLQMLGLADGRMRGHDDTTEYSTEANDDPEFLRVSSKLRKILSDPWGTAPAVYVPLGISKHVDHLMCRDAVLAGTPLRRIVFYEDLPYASTKTEEEIECFARAIDSRLTACLVRTRQFEARKRRAIESYTTQLEPHTAARILGHGTRVGHETGPCERYWRAL
jgi:LmbE family N-acetylglucosaminyl deacetylase